MSQALPKSILFVGRECDGIRLRQQLDLCQRDVNENQTFDRLVRAGKVIERLDDCRRSLANYFERSRFHLR